MPNYKKVSKTIIEGFIEKLFSKVGKDIKSKTLDKLASKDPQLKSDLETLATLRKKMNKRLNTKAKKDAAFDRIMKQYG